MEYRYIVSVAIIITVFLAGCISTNDDQWPLWHVGKAINSITGSMNISYDEVMKMNETNTSTSLSEKGYRFHNMTYEDNSTELYLYGAIADIYYWIAKDSPYTQAWPLFEFWVRAWKDNQTYIDYGMLKFLSHPSNATEKEIEMEKTKLIEKANEVAQICNLTLNWTNVQFVVSYMD